MVGMVPVHALIDVASSQASARAQLVEDEDVSHWSGRVWSKNMPGSR
jgi:hypothetical protein